MAVNVSSKKRVTKNSRAGLVFPIAKINKRLVQSGWTERVGRESAIWLSASCQYLLQEIIEAAAQNCQLDGKKRINTRDIILAVRNDEALNRLLSMHRAFVGDKIKKVGDDFAIGADKRYAEKLGQMKHGDGIRA